MAGPTQDLTVLLALDVGNTTTVLGVFDGTEVRHHWRVSTEPRRTGDEWALLIHGLLRLEGVSFGDDLEGVVIGSVVPAVTTTLRAMVERYFHSPPLVVEPGTRTGMPLRYDNPREIGADRIANAVAAYARYGGPAVVVDFGTATSFDAVSADGEFVGGAIAPGVQSSISALVRATARLPEVETVAPPTAIGRSTTAALQSGIVFGFAGQVDAIVNRMKAELGEGTTVVATGGLATAVLDACTTIDHHDPWLTLDGLRIIWERNQPTSRAR